ncbi:ATP-binding protein [Deinococcus peraridilitoris]|uniref:histidine kinase n=1 Tax=Deinococcus peraridilitoris (strain DSM 19664 / LMG 22246 / CIP 109416 / KR-200) TaxID=937777 RepID=L0A6X3_DEIPD|nr:ATP-binding protein [Deinococcus peraridilitoris]AFZ69189.1 bacteriophytochrome (light-regulated signal transduction histidine kinase) [Deinococcus peraridilitoris DSM 19664]
MPDTPTPSPTTAPPSAASQRADHLIARLQDVTEQLAAARTQEQVFVIVLQPALQALKALAGVVLLVNAAKDRLEIAAVQGYEEGAQTIWQNGPLNGNGPAGDVLRKNTPLFFEHQDDLLRAYPELAAQSGVTLPVATAVLPMFLDERPLGTLVLDFQEPYRFSDEERRFLRTLASQCAIAFGRAQLTTRLRGQLQERTSESEVARDRAEVLAALGDALQRAATPEEVAQLALPRIGPALRAQCMLMVRLDACAIRLPTLWGDTPEVIVSYMTRPGLSLRDTPVLQRVADSGQGLYLDDYHREPGTVWSFPALANGVEPIHTPDGTLEGFLVTWRPVVQHGWQEGERDLLKRAAATLGLALERAQSAAQLEAQHAALDARNRVLAAAEDWARDLTLDTDPFTLIRRAQELLYMSLPVQAAAYYEREGDRWFVRSMLGEFGNDDLRRAHDAGLPHATTGSLRVPFETGEVHYQDEYDVSIDGMPEHTSHVAATAMLPLMTVHGVRGIFGLALFDRTGWTGVGRAIIETVGRSLALALDRADQAVELTRERAALAAANEELEAFAYSVSHDLRTPVRHIMGFNDLLRKSFGTSLDPKAAQYLQVVDQAAARMNILINAMLDLSRTSRQPLLMRLVDLGALVASVQAELELEMLDRKVLWQVSPLPLISADHNLLRQVMLNLLANALKYTRTKEAGNVEVWAEEREDEWAIFVRDNGVGFDPRYADKLFGVFQRLHRQEEFEGTGVGLANVRRIVQRHGGRVWAQSTLGEGATFGFVLPKPD